MQVFDLVKINGKDPNFRELLDSLYLFSGIILHIYFPFFSYLLLDIHRTRNGKMNLNLILRIQTKFHFIQSYIIYKNWRDPWYWIKTQIPNKIMFTIFPTFSQFSRSVMSDSATQWTVERQASLSINNFWLYPNLCPLSWRCHPTISSSVILFSSHLQSFPASGSFQMSQFFASGDQSIGITASTSVLTMNTQDWFPLGWIGWIPCSSSDSQ